MLKAGVRLNVFAIKRIGEEGAVWTRAGSAWINRDGSMNLKLDVLPLGGELHVREPSEEKKDSGSVAAQRVSSENTNPPSLEAADAAASMGGH